MDIKIANRRIEDMVFEKNSSSFQANAYSLSNEARADA